ncbi:hypothetical protein R1sor_013829 [Riccia sorocarpa]|uniref:Uncharacterized protein n=1 Tax=Riccia sorocarpa TaxID=122646 RepID=A0ABD3HAW4_9MARC
MADTAESSIGNSGGNHRLTPTSPNRVSDCSQKRDCSRKRKLSSSVLHDGSQNGELLSSYVAGRALLARTESEEDPEREDIDDIGISSVEVEQLPTVFRETYRSQGEELKKLQEQLKKLAEEMKEHVNASMAVAEVKMTESLAASEVKIIG